MGLFKKKNKPRSNKEICEERSSINLVPYICDGEKWNRIYYEDEIETMRREAYERGLKERIENAPSVDVVSRGLFEQYKWERDVAISQLEELGIGFGQKIDGVYLTNEEYEKLLEYKHMYEDLCK